MKKLRDKQTGEIVEVIEVREGWVSVEDRLPELHKKGNWKISNRCVVLVNKRGTMYEAFATLEEYLSTGVTWSIEGHNGDWHKNVTHWFQIPVIQAAPTDKE